jgi:hypothetical protein
MGRRSPGERGAAPLPSQSVAPACAWLVAEIHPEDGDTTMGLIDNGQGFPVLGYFRLSEITCPSKRRSTKTSISTSSSGLSASSQNSTPPPQGQAPSLSNREP